MSQQANSPNTRPQGYWTDLNFSSRRERSFFEHLVEQLVLTIEEPVRTGPGRPALSRRAMVSDLLHKVHENRPSRKFESDLIYYEEEGIRDEQVPHFNTVNKYMREPWVTHTLLGMLIMTSYPMRKVEKLAAVDSTGFISRPPGQWNEIKHGRDNEKAETRKKRRRRLRRGVKAHLISGVQSNIIMAATVTHIDASDHNELEELLDQALGRFVIEKLLGDAAYMSHKHFEMLAALGIIPYIDFTSAVVEPPLDGTMWSKMFHLYTAHKEIWERHYHLRSNIETTNYMVKGSYGEYLLSRDPIAQTNEALAKCVCHNIWVLNKQTKILGIDPLDFGVELLPDDPVNDTNGANGTNGHGISIIDLSDLPHHNTNGHRRLNGIPNHPCLCQDCLDQGLFLP